MLYWHCLAPLWKGFGLLRTRQKVVSTLQPMMQISHLRTMNDSLIATLDETNLIHHSTHGEISFWGLCHGHAIHYREVHRIGACMASMAWEGPHMYRIQHGTYNVWRIQSGMVGTCGTIVSSKKELVQGFVGWSHEQKPPQCWNIRTTKQLYTPKDPKKRISRHMLYLKMLL